MVHSHSPIVAFCSYSSSLGQSNVIINVASLLEKWQRRVLLVDCDLLGQGLEKRINNPNLSSSASGLYLLLQSAINGNRTNWRDHVVKIGSQADRCKVDLLSAGTIKASAVGRSVAGEQKRLLSSDGVAAYLEALRLDWAAEYDAVLINAQPNLDTPESAWTLRLADTVVVLLTADTELLDKTIQALQQRFSAFHPLSLHRQSKVVPVTVRRYADAFSQRERAWTPHLASAFQPYFERWAPGIAGSMLAERLKVSYPASETPVQDSSRALVESRGVETLARLIAHGLQWNQLEKSPMPRTGRLKEDTVEQSNTSAVVEALLAEAEAAKSKHCRIDAVSITGMAVAIWRKCDKEILSLARPRIARVQAYLMASWYRERKTNLGDATSPYHIALAAALSNLSGLLNQLRDMRGAIDASRASIELRRRFAAQSPTTYAPELARSLHNLGKRLAAVKDHRNALEAAAEAVSIRRRLAHSEPAKYAAALARSLLSLSNRFAEVGERDKALVAMRESLTIFRRLAKIGVAGAQEHLARTLSTLAQMHGDVGDCQRAAVTMWESVRIWMRLHKQRSTYACELAQAFHNFSLTLADTGKGLMAITAAERSVALFRKLSATDGCRYEPLLAASLNNLSNRLAVEGYGRRALKAIQEAVDIRARLTKDNPDRYSRDLAQSLNNLSNRIAATGNWLKALDAIDKAVELRTKFALEDNKHYGHDLLVSLYNRSLRLVEADEGGLAMQTVNNVLQNMHGILTKSSTMPA